jgi:hypothetical protein
MPTGDKLINVFVKKLLSKTDLKDRLVQFMQDRNDEVIAALFSGRSGVLDQDPITLSTGSSGDGYVQADTSQARKLVTGDGHIITLPSSPTIPLTDDVPFENTGAVPYYFGVRYAQPVAQQVEINERTGKPEYPALEESYGELGTPASITDDPGVKISINVNNLLESGVDHSGRAVTVYLATPVSGLVATAFFSGQVSYSAPNNVIEITYSGANGPLGQDTSVDPPSTTAADYVVHVRGLSWKRNTDLRLDPTYAFLATVTGGTPATFDHVDQLSIFINDLDFAYDGLAGSGSGSRINADSGAVHIRSADSGDGPGAPNNPTGYRTTQLIDRSNSTEAQSVGFTVVADEGDGANALHLVPLIETSGPDLNLLETADTLATAGQLSLTRGGVDAFGSGVENYDLALLTGFSGPAVGLNGLYTLSTVGVALIILADIATGAAPGGWPGAGHSGQVTLLRARFKVGNELFGLTPAGSRLAPIVSAQGGNKASAEPVLGVFPNAHEVSLALHTDDDIPARRMYADNRGRLVGDSPSSMDFDQFVSNPTMNAQQLLNRNQNTDWMQFMYAALEGDVSAIPFAALQVLRGTGLAHNFACDQTGTQGLTITTGGTNLLTAALQFLQRAKLGMLLWLRTGTDAGFYVIKETPITGTTIEVTPLGGTGAPGTWSVETGLTGSILIPRFWVGNGNPYGGTLFDPLGGLTHVANSGQNVLRPLRVYTMKDGAGPSDRVLTVHKDDGIDDDALALRMSGDGQIEIGGVSSNPGTIPAVQAGLTIRPRARGTGNADKFALNVKPATIIQLENMLPSHRAIGLFGESQNEIERWTASGRWARVTRFREDFQQSNISIFQTAGVFDHRWSDSSLGGGVVECNSPTLVNAHSGILRLSAPGAADRAGIIGPNIFTIKETAAGSALTRFVNIAGAFRIVGTSSPADLTQMEFFIGLTRINTRIGVTYDVAGAAGNITGITDNGAGTIITNVGNPAVLGGPNDPSDQIVKFHMRGDRVGNSISVWLTGDSSIDGMNWAVPASAVWENFFAPYVFLTNKDANPKEAHVLYLEIWDEDIDFENGPKE